MLPEELSSFILTLLFSAILSLLLVIHVNLVVPVNQFIYVYWSILFIDVDIIYNCYRVG